jgi:ribosomal-protein-alanine N-acetyltransferase
MNYSIKPLRAEYEAFMWELLYRAIFEARDTEHPNRDLKDLPELKHYIEHWGEKKGDYGLVALDESNQPIGAVWIRQFSETDQAWGFVDEQTPELNIALVPDHRNTGIGTKLMVQLLKDIEGKFNQLSLSVNPKNPSVRLYERFGFVKYADAPPAITMVKAMKL